MTDLPLRVYKIYNVVLDDYVEGIYYNRFDANYALSDLISTFALIDCEVSYEVHEFKADYKYIGIAS